jgi:hypothetical protein
MSKAGRIAPFVPPLSNASPPDNPRNGLRCVQSLLLCFVLPLSTVSAQTPQPTSQPSGQSEQQIQPVSHTSSVRSWTVVYVTAR